MRKKWYHLYIQQYMRGVISGLRREVDVKCSLLGYYVGCSGNFPRRFGTTYRSQIKGPRITQKSTVHIYFEAEV